MSELISIDLVINFIDRNIELLSCQYYNRNTRFKFKTPLDNISFYYIKHNFSFYDKELLGHIYINNEDIKILIYSNLSDINEVKYDEVDKMFEYTFDLIYFLKIEYLNETLFKKFIDKRDVDYIFSLIFNKKERDKRKEKSLIEYLNNN